MPWRRRRPGFAFASRAAPGSAGRGGGVGGALGGGGSRAALDPEGVLFSPHTHAPYEEFHSTFQLHFTFHSFSELLTLRSSRSHLSAALCGGVG